MKSFKNIDAKSVGEAVELLAKFGQEVAVVRGVQCRKRKACVGAHQVVCPCNGRAGWQHLSYPGPNDPFVRLRAGNGNGGGLINFVIT